MTMEPSDSFSYRREYEANSWNEVYENFGQMCRICAAASDFLIPIFEGEGLQHRLDLKIQLYLPIQVLKDDILPLQLCYACATTILSWHSLLLSCQDADQKFRLMIGMKEPVELQDRHEALLISSPQTSGNLHMPSQSDLDLNLTSISQSDSHPDLVTSVPPHPPMSSTIRDSEHLSCVLLSNRSLHNYNLSNAEDIDQGVLDGMMNSDLPALPPDLSSDVMTNVSNFVSENISNFPNPSQQPVQLTHVATQTDKIMDNISDEHELGKKASVGRKIAKQSCTLKRKRNNDIIIQQSPALIREEESSNIPNRVSTIQSISSGAIWSQQENNCSRSKSVLVRNESFRPTPSIDEVGDSNTSPTENSDAGTLVESAVIREHRNVGTKDDSGNGTVVSFVRPTCLRRAPTKVEVIENVVQIGIPNVNQGETGYSQVFYSDSKDGFLHSQKQENNCEVSTIVSSCVDGPSSNSSPEEKKNLDLMHTCFYCKKFISNSVLLLAHEKSHLSDRNPPKSFVCKFCSLSQSSISEMHFHYSQHTREVDKVRKSIGSRKAYLCKQCGQMFTTEERLAAHQRSHFENAESFRHECKTCRETFSTRSKLSVHLWSHAVKPSLKTFKCHICGKGFCTKSAVMEHRLKHTEEEKSRAFKCVICGMAFGNNTLLGKHRSTHSEEELARPFKCTFCCKAFARNHTLQIHHLTHSDEKSHLCSQCGKGFKMRNSLIQHLRTHQDPSAWPTYSCNLCEKIFKIKSRLRDHLRMHSGDKPYQCGTCGKGFHKVTALHTHEVSHTDKRPYMCDVCGKAFKWSKNLRQHKSVHIVTDKVSESSNANARLKLKTKNQPCQCEICGKQLSGKSSLRQHITNIHNEGIPKQTTSTSCPVCGKVLSSAGGMVRHVKITHGGVKAFKCDICDREYATKVARDDHRRSHTGERPYVCKVCSKTFTSLSNLHIHRLTHSEDRPHKCSYCDKQFKRRAHLIPHIRTHTGEKPYVCSICSRGFAQSNDLHKHRLTHSDDKAYACHCGMAFRIKRDLTRHQVKHHPVSSTSRTASQENVHSLNFNSVKIAESRQYLILPPGQQSVDLHQLNPTQSYGNNVNQSVVVRNSDVQDHMNI